jgi:hypothetical protein
MLLFLPLEEDENQETLQFFIAIINQSGSIPNIDDFSILIIFLGKP